MSPLGLGGTGGGGGSGGGGLTLGPTPNTFTAATRAGCGDFA